MKLFFSLVFAVAYLISVHAFAAVPAAVTAAGYTAMSFDTESFSAANVDMGVTRESGFQWYFYNFFNGTVASPANVSLNPDGTITFLGDTTGPNGQISTVTSCNVGCTAKGVSGQRGHSFGGGAYFEASIKVSNTIVSANSNHVPAFWALASEHLTSAGPGTGGLGADRWPGLPGSSPGVATTGYNHFSEIDIMEWNRGSADVHSCPNAQSPSNPCPIYGATTWDHVQNVGGTPSDLSQKSCFACGNASISGADMNQYHTYGALWIPATPSALGSIVYYFDNNVVGSSQPTWTPFYGQTGPFPVANLLTGPTWEAGIIDLQHMALILGTSDTTYPFTVQWVHVWQAPNPTTNWVN